MTKPNGKGMEQLSVGKWKHTIPTLAPPSDGGLPGSFIGKTKAQFRLTTAQANIGTENGHLMLKKGRMANLKPLRTSPSARGRSVISRNLEFGCREYVVHIDVEWLHKKMWLNVRLMRYGAIWILPEAWNRTAQQAMHWRGLRLWKSIHSKHSDLIQKVILKSTSFIQHF